MNYIKITAPDLENGEGCRVTLWIAGCAHHCKGCHNPETWNYKQGNDIFSEKCLNDIEYYLNKPYIDGLTISGGDPLSQSESDLKILETFINQIKIFNPNKTIWIYAGDTWDDILMDPYKKAIIELCDVIVEGPYIEFKRNTSLAFRGSENQRIIDIQKSLKENKVCLYDK